MTKNMGIVDRTLRLLAAAVIAALYSAHQITGTLGAVLGIVGVVFFVTSVIGFCPLYVPLGLSTRKGLTSRADVMTRTHNIGGHYGRLHT